MDLQRIIWLASYPKSGNTWLRLLLANYFQPGDAPVDINQIHRFATSDTRQDFFDRAAGRRFIAQDVEDWLAVRPRALRLIAASKPGHQFVKTHCRIGRMNGQITIPPALTAGAVYIHRNPFDVAVSYARHQVIGINEAIVLMADRKALNASESGIFDTIGRWDDHIESWLRPEGLWRHAIRYEDMTADTEQAMRLLLTFLKVPVEDGKLRRAIRWSSFDSLKRQEQEKGFIERPPKMKRFFASGRAGEWRETLTPAQISRIRTEFAVALEEFYPELHAETAKSVVRKRAGSASDRTAERHDRAGGYRYADRGGGT